MQSSSEKNKMMIDIEKEEDGRWIAEFSNLPSGERVGREIPYD
jgi:hypothetical protein